MTAFQELYIDFPVIAICLEMYNLWVSCLAAASCGLSLHLLGSVGVVVLMCKAGECRSRVQDRQCSSYCCGYEGKVISVAV